MKRIATALVAVPLTVAIVLGLPQTGLLLVAILIVGVAVFEYVQLVRRAGADRAVVLLLGIVPIAAVALCADLWGYVWSGPQPVLLAILICSGLMAVAVLASRGDARSSLVAIGALSFGLAYFPAGIVGFARLHGLHPWVLMVFLVMVWSGDTAAYLVGTRWGRKKLAPVVSPNKTWLGAAASLVATVLVAGLWTFWWFGAIEPAFIGAAAAASLAAQLGDLVESLLKRGVGVKDSASLLPGHGGMLDRLDGLLMAAPCFYLLLWALGAAV